MTLELPQEVAAMVAALQAAGFTMATEDSDSFGDRLVTLSRPPLEVRAVRDRGDWDVEARGSGWSRWYDAALWRASLAGEAAPDTAEDRAGAAAFFAEHHEVMAGAVERDPDGLAARLDDEDLARMRRHHPTASEEGGER